MSNHSITDWYSRVLSIIAIIGSSYAFWINYCTSKLHLEPSVKCFLEKHNNNKLSFTIKNEGALTASLLSVAFYQFMYYPKKEIVSVMSMHTSWFLKVPAENWLYIENLKPNEMKTKSVTDNRNQERDYIFIYLLKINFYRENDMKLFTKDSIFFADKHNIYSHDEFKKRPDYKHIRQQMNISFHQNVREGHKDLI